MRTVLITPERSADVLRLPPKAFDAHARLRHILGGTPDPVQLAALTFWCGPTPQPNALASLLGYQLSGEVHHFHGPVAVSAGPRQDFTPTSLSWLLRTTQLLAGQESALARFQQAGEIHQTWQHTGTSTSVQRASDQ